MGVGLQLGRASYVLAPLDVPPQLGVPHDDDVIDAAEIQSPPPPARRRSDRHLPDVDALDDPEEPGVWSVRGPDLARLLGLPDTLALQALVEAELRERMPELSARVELDSERDCFFAHCRNEADARQLADLLSDLAPPVAAGRDRSGVRPGSARRSTCGRIHGRGPLRTTRRGPLTSGSAL